MEEIWKKCIDYPHYAVSNFGRIKALGVDFIRIDGRRTVTKEGVMKCHFNKFNGYMSVILSVNNKPKTFYVHRLVAVAFIPNTLYVKEVNHKDGNKTNNHLDNLEWVTRKQNHRHRFDVLGHTSYKKGVINGIGSKPVVQKRVNGEVVNTYLSISDAARINNFNSSSIVACLKGRYHTTGGYKWDYLLPGEQSEMF